MELQNKIAKFFAKYPKKEFKRGQLIITPEKEYHAVYYLVSGYVKQYTVSQDGRIKAVNIFKRGAYFPIILALAKYENKYYFEAINKVEVYEAPVGEVVKLLMKDNEVILNLCTRFLIGVDGILNILQSIMYETSRKKLAAFILMLTRRFGKENEDGSVQIDIPLTHQDIASFTGMIRETVSFEMKKLQKDRIIADNNKRKAIVILNTKELEAILK